MDRLDVSAWLAVNKLSYVEKIFVERNISIEELVDFDKEELKDFAKDLRLDALATRRFIQAIEDQKVLGGKIKPSSSSSSSLSKKNESIVPYGANSIQRTISDVETANDEAVAPAFNYNVQQDVVPEGMLDEGDKEGVEGPGEGENYDKALLEKEVDLSMPIDMKLKSGIQGKDAKVHIIVTPVEQEALTKLQERLDLCETLIDSIESSWNQLHDQSEQTKKDIGKKMELVVDTLKQKEQTVLKDAQQMQQNKETTLKAQLKYLMDHQTALNACKKRYEELIADTSKDVHERRVEVVGMCSNILNDKNVLLSMATAPDIKFGFHFDVLRQFNTRLTINDCDQPAPPMDLNVIKIGSELIWVEWKMLELAENKPILEISFEAALLPESEVVPEKSDQKGKKDKTSGSKKKKDSKKKKSKKKSKDSDDDDSEESEEESDEESDESEESESDSDDSRKKRKKKKKKGSEEEDESDSDDNRKKTKKEKCQ